MNQAPQPLSRPYISHPRRSLRTYRRKSSILLSSTWRPDCPLSDREKQILEAVAKGCSTRIIAHDLTLSIKTVDNHRANLMRKLNVHNVAKLVRAYDTWTTIHANERAELEGLRALRQRYDHIMGFISTVIASPLP